MQEALLEQLNSPIKEDRLESLTELMKLHKDGSLPKPPKTPTEYVNNHIHTTYSFSPYSPSGAAYTAWRNGLTTAGIMDHDSVGGAEEFKAAGKIINIATTAGMECRCDLSGTPFEGMRVNNPDQKSVAYLAMHGIPEQSFATVQEFLIPYREKRNLRNRRMIKRLNKVLAPCGVSLDFYSDVAPISSCAGGGSITERHILYALSGKLMDSIGKGEKLLGVLKEKLSIEVTGSNREKLLQTEDPMYQYYLLNVLKSSLVEQFYIDASDECPHVSDFIKLCDDVGAISAYAYLGDVAGSVTGDKKDQTFEDAYLDELVAWLAQSGFRALTYMPTRNTPEQLERIMTLCHKYGLFQISGEDINSPFQSFLCSALEKPGFGHLVDAAWALIGHEKASLEALENGMFSPASVSRWPALRDRVEYFAQVGKGK